MQADIANDAGHYQQATALYEDILKRSPGMDIAANNLAAMIADYQFTDPAALDKAYHLAQKFSNSPHPELLDTLAWVYYRQGNTAAALSTMTRVTQSMPTLTPEMHYHYGAILLKAGKTAQAKAELSEATASDNAYPGMDDAKALLAPL